MNDLNHEIFTYKYTLNVLEYLQIIVCNLLFSSFQHWSGDKNNGLREGEMTEEKGDKMKS